MIIIYKVKAFASGRDGSVEGVRASIELGVVCGGVTAFN